MTFPRYRYPPFAALRLAAGLLSGGRRSFRRDAQAYLAYLRPPLRLLGEGNVPERGPCLVTFNHYSRPGFSAWWLALALAATLPAEMHFVATGELTFPGRWYGLAGRPLSRWLLRRFSKIYGFTLMPPMPPRPQDVAARARAVRVVLAYVKDNPRAILGLAPEGMDSPGGVLARPPSGAGRFILHLTDSRSRIVPVGAFEQDGALCLHFGEAYHLEVPPSRSADEVDRAAAAAVMQAIARLMPIALRGEFA